MVMVKKRRQIFIPTASIWLLFLLWEEEKSRWLSMINIHFYFDNETILFFIQAFKILELGLLTFFSRVQNYPWLEMLVWVFRDSNHFRFLLSDSKRSMHVCRAEWEKHAHQGRYIDTRIHDEYSYLKILSDSILWVHYSRFIAIPARKLITNRTNQTRKRERNTCCMTIWWWSA